VWIIRNGINDLAQTAATDFTSFHNIGNVNAGTANGNGAVRFEIAVKTPAEGSTSSLEITDGKFVGPADSTTPEISFTTGGYEDEAEVYYAVVPKGETPDYSDYELLDGSVEAGDHRETINLDEANGDYDVYVIVYKDGEVSDPIVINTKEGGEDIDWVWLIEELYVKSSGNDNNTGDREHPLATVQAALNKIQDNYSAISALDAWPGKGTADEANVKIVIMDEVPVAAQITINNSGSIYPPIVLRDDAQTPGGKLQALASIGSGKSILRLENGADVTLEGGLVLEGTGVAEDNIRGVVILGNNAAFTMNGGEISGNSGNTSGGGGVSVYHDGMFTMNGGEISGNSVHDGGGVFVFASTFTMNSGKISGNSSYGYAGGVHITASGTFTMNGGEISGNSGNTSGGVYVNLATFTMNGGEISGNSGNTSGGVYEDNGVFIMSGGEISGNSASYGGGGVYLLGGNSSVFAKTGGIIYGYDAGDLVYSNKVEENNAIVNNKGHAVYRNVTYRKETTLGPDDDLFYNYPSYGQHSGW
jgi:hypothetical protein